MRRNVGSSVEGEKGEKAWQRRVHADKLGVSYFLPSVKISEHSPRKIDAQNSGPPLIGLADYWGAFESPSLSVNLQTTRFQPSLPQRMIEGDRGINAGRVNSGLIGKPMKIQAILRLDKLRGEWAVAFI